MKKIIATAVIATIMAGSLLGCGADRNSRSRSKRLRK